jgi:pimeloyl-ACP methyl ester carboxylesterase
MQSRSSLAHLLQAISLLLVSAAAAWLVWHWNTSPLLGVLGFFAIALAHSLVLAIEFVALRILGGDEGVSQPTWREVGRAWLGETVMALRVFFWRQPYRWREVPDQLDPPREPRRGVVFIHGFVCNRGLWTPWLKQLRASGHCFVAVNLEPVFGSIDEYVPSIEQAVVQVTQATGMPPILVCHSMGGLAARAWLREMPGAGRVHHVITIASPHHGTWLARFGYQQNSRQMRRDSAWRAALEKSSAESAYAGFTCWYSNCDNIVFPASTATLPGARNLLVTGAAHVELAFHDRVMAESLALIAM